MISSIISVLVYVGCMVLGSIVGYLVADAQNKQEWIDFYKEGLSREKSDH